ncbi:Uncharacterized protein BM_BM5070 [Brugia malayi]|uniref:Bm5070 n=1 Tax=Brugia malayi TaxID=6279 RepID=A0A1U7F0H2_BRUMA|nr:Uncharacterized protein BM_BM5070 [Brugia malayi]CDP93699.1 Bm5070 [Brugia malayi]VIO92351.1 Uncharacterized protein BM_BM5070 [Brugia malayi]
MGNEIIKQDLEKKEYPTIRYYHLTHLIYYQLLPYHNNLHHGQFLQL